MKPYQEISSDAIDRLYLRLYDEAEKSGYHLNPDAVFTKQLVRGLIINEDRYGYWACPCRLASSVKADDLDIICPCDYRDPDLDESGACYCALYVNDAVRNGSQKLTPVPERRPARADRKKLQPPAKPAGVIPFTALPLPVWRCRVCGYLCAREQPPGICPICKVPKDRFERFI